MCHYVTAVLPSDANIAVVGEIFDHCKLGFELVENAYVLAQLPTGRRYVLTTRKHCDCGTVLGSMAHTTDRTPNLYGREVERFRRQGWSGAKIERWLAEKQAAREKSERKTQHELEGGTAEANDWIDLLGSVLGSGGTKRVGLILHWYKSGVANERIGLEDTITTQMAEVTPEFLMMIREDVLYNFTL